MRFRTSDGLIAIALIALGLVVLRDRSLWIAVLTPLAAGICVVLPVLGLYEWLAPDEVASSRMGWRAVLLILLVGLGGTVLALAAAVLIAMLA
jgi:hypothetical protein